ncbi:MarR family winged helix-turn-helix transcriptional regulator [Pontimicrobium sp. IMCC45349]|uniref:MarR family winged helix-turn-helix transcriptional regulator n=1 Tax=Pontimicrobium sp. IMCC45349 TaxID=3391574 RepID=UPI0039A3AD0B
MKWKDLYIKNIENPQQKAILNVMYTGVRFEKYTNNLLKEIGLSSQQYDLLKVLLEFPDKGMSLKEIQMRLINQTSNATRLVEKLRLKGLLKTKPSKENRSKLEIRITQKGIDLIENFKPTFDEIIGLISDAMSEREAKEVSRVLTMIQDALDSEI